MLRRCSPPPFSFVGISQKLPDPLPRQPLTSNMNNLTLCTEIYPTRVAWNSAIRAIMHVPSYNKSDERACHFGILMGGGSTLLLSVKKVRSYSFKTDLFSFFKTDTFCALTTLNGLGKSTWMIRLESKHSERITRMSDSTLQHSKIYLRLSVEGKIRVKRSSFRAESFKHWVLEMIKIKYFYVTYSLSI